MEILNELPGSIDNLTNLDELRILDNSELSKLPDSINKLKNVTYFEMRGHFELPSNIHEFKKLQTLEISSEK